jgi:hypothetical protein
VQEVEESEPATRRLLVALLSEAARDTSGQGHGHADVGGMSGAQRTGSGVQWAYDYDTEGGAWIADTQDVSIFPQCCVAQEYMHFLVVLCDFAASSRSKCKKSKCALVTHPHTRMRMLLLGMLTC